MLKEELALVLRGNEIEHEKFGLEVKFEHFLVKAGSLESVSYSEENGIADFLDYLAGTDWEGIYEEDYIIGARKNNLTILLGVGGQIQLTIEKINSIIKIDRAYLEFVKEIMPELENRGLILLSLGYMPKTLAQDVEVVPMKVAQALVAHYKDNKQALELMKASAKTSVTIDYAHNDDFERKMMVATMLSPVLTAMFDNVPLWGGELYQDFCGNQALLNQVSDGLFTTDKIWTADGKYKYNEYAKYVAKAPAVVKAEGESVAAVEGSVSDVYGEEISQDDAKAVLNMQRSDIKVTDRGIELSMIDALPYPLNMAAVTLIKGIFYNKDHMDNILDSFKELENKDILELKKNILEKGLDTPFGEGNMLNYAKDIFFMVSETLPPKEQHYLQPLDMVLFKGALPKKVSARQLSK